MARLFDSLFGRSEKKADESFPAALKPFSKYDPDYIAYCVELEQIVSALEEELHKSDNPKEIALETLKVACEFYGGNWAGILEVDIELDVWNPLWWYNAGIRDLTTERFAEFEIAKFMPNWVHALNTGKPIIILDAKEVAKEYPEEYEVYKRLAVDSVIGVPFGPNPVGFLAIRNPTRYVNYPSMMSILAYVLHRAMAQEKTIESSKMALSHKEIQSDRDIIINFFGNMEIITSQGVLRERNFKSPTAARVATFLMLNRKSAFASMEIVEELWPDEQSKWDNLSTNIRGYIHKFRKAFELISPYDLIITTANGYRINPDFHIMTDLQQFDLLWEKAQHAVSISQKVDMLKQAFELYKGTVYENACDDHWVIGTVTHYKSRYIGIVNELLAALADAKEYHSVQQYASGSIKHAPENYMAYYWLIHAMVQLGTLELAKNEIIHAKNNLTSEEFASMKKRILSDARIPAATLFDED